MNQEKTIEMLRKRNILLQEENTNLQKQLGEKKENEDLVSMFKELEALKNKWEKELKTIQKQRTQYAKLISDARKLKKVKVAFEE